MQTIQMTKRTVIKPRTITLMWWSCAKEHRHRTKEAAEACIAKSIKVKLPPRWTPALKRAVFACVAKGGTWAEAAAKAGISKERARQVVHKMQRHMLHPSQMDEERPVRREDGFSCYSTSVELLRERCDFWLRRLDKTYPPETQDQGMELWT